MWHAHEHLARENGSGISTEAMLGIRTKIRELARAQDMEQRIAEIRAQLGTLGEELLKLTAPTEKELAELREDAETEPQIYMSYLTQDPIFLAENILDNRECERESNDA